MTWPARSQPPRPLRLQVFHQTYIKVNEEGTEAAAATGVTVVMETMAAHEEPTVLVFDRPFLCFSSCSATPAREPG